MKNNATVTAPRRRSLAGVEPAWIAAWQALAADVALTLAAACHMLTRNLDADLQSQTHMRAASFLPGAASPTHAARAALKAARRDVAENATALREVAAEVDAGMIEVIDAAPNAALTLGRWAPQADVNYRTSYADLIDAAMSQTTGAAREGLQALTTAWLAHERTDCTTCQTTRPTLAGIVAHMEGLTTRDAAGKAHLRAAKRALAAIPGYGTADGDAPAWEAWEALTALLADPAPMSPATYSKPASTPHASPVTVDHAYDVATLIVTTAGHTTAREASALETWTAANPACRHGGMKAHTDETGEVTACGQRTEDRESSDGREDYTRPVTDARRDGGMLRKGSRKGNGGTGSTGPTVPTRLAGYGA